MVDHFHEQVAGLVAREEEIARARHRTTYFADRLAVVIKTVDTDYPGRQALAQLRAGLGDSPRTILTEFSRITAADIVLHPARAGRPLFTTLPLVANLIVGQLLHLADAERLVQPGAAAGHRPAERRAWAVRPTAPVSQRITTAASGAASRRARD